MRDTLDRSLTSTGWVANYDAGKWATDLLPKRPGKIAASLGGDKCSRPYQTEEKASPFWQPAMHQRTNRKPAVNGTPTMFALNGTSPIYSYPYHESDWSTTSFAASDGVRNFSLNTFAKANDM